MWSESHKQPNYSLFCGPLQNFEVMLMNLEPAIQSEFKSEKEKWISYITAYIWNLENWCWGTYLQGRNRDSDIEKGLVDTGEGVVDQPLSVSDSFQTYGLQHARPPRLSPSLGISSNSCPLSRWCHPTISSSVTPFSSCPQSFPASGSFPMSQFFISC